VKKRKITDIGGLGTGSDNEFLYHKSKLRIQYNTIKCYSAQFTKT